MKNSLRLDLLASDVTRSSSYIPALTGLRAVAAYPVFLHHYNPATPGTFAHKLFFQGYIGVSVFFVLSGFLIYYRYADAYLARKNWSWCRYLQNRFARIFPLYALLLFVTTSVNVMLGRPMTLLVFGLNLTLLKGFFEFYKFSGIAQSWSLTVETCFYLFAPLLFICLGRWGAFWLNVSLISIGLLLWTMAGQIIRYGFFGNLPFVLFYTFFGRAFEFIVGMWLAQCWQQKRLPNYRFATFSGLIIVSAAVIWQTNAPMFTINHTELVWSEVIAYNYVLPVGIGLVFMGILRKPSRFRYVLSRPLVQKLGRSSYAFYLIHIGVVASGLQKVGVTNNGLLFSTLVLIAYSLYIFIEKPLQRRLRAY